MDMRVGKAREDDAAAEVDDLRRGERRLVHADAAGDQAARDRERALGPRRWVKRPDQAVLEDHDANTASISVMHGLLLFAGVALLVTLTPGPATAMRVALEAR